MLRITNDALIQSQCTDSLVMFKSDGGVVIQLSHAPSAPFQNYINTWSSFPLHRWCYFNCSRSLASLPHTWQSTLRRPTLRLASHTCHLQQGNRSLHRVGSDLHRHHHTTKLKNKFSFGTQTQAFTPPLPPLHQRSCNVCPN
jgi:hypothetical protein